MLRQKEQRNFLLLTVVVFALTIICVIVFNMSKITILVAGTAIFIVYLGGVLLIEHINKRIYDIRISTEDTRPNKREIYVQDELGRLASEIDKLIAKYKDSVSNGVREKEFLRDIISDMSHQIKTPLSSLILFNDIMLEDMNDERLRDMLEQSQVQLERMRWLILSMLRLSKLEAKSVIFNKDNISPADVINSSLDILKQSIREKGLCINLKLADGMIYADSEWLKEALINILKNAIEYSSDGGDIDISLETTPIATTISIKDYGPGIMEKDCLNIFKRFYSDDSNPNRTGNVGIGLSLSKSIIEEMGGKIWVDTKHFSECIFGETSYTCINIMF